MKNRTEHWVSIKKGLDKLLSVAFFFCIIVIVWLLFQVIGFVSFKIPSDSMEPALFAGDNILVNKWVMGGHKGRGEYFKGKTDCRNGISEP